MKILYSCFIVLFVFLNKSTSISNNSTLIDNDTFSYSREEVLPPLKSNSSWFHYKTFTVISNVIEGIKPDYFNTLTLVLHMSNDRSFHGLHDRFINWRGPISIGIYMVDNNLVISKETINTICILKKYIKNRKNISVHLIFQKIIITDDDVNYLKNISLCYKKNDMKDNNFIGKNNNEIKKVSLYPINTIRNIARKLSKSKFLIVTDSDQMFSPGFEDKVLPVIKNEYAKNKKNVFVIRVFETTSEKLINGPKNKKQLLKLLKTHKAFVFHHSNIIYHGIIKLKEWFKVKDNNESSVQIEIPYNNDAWEPKIIISKDAPYHDENFFYPYRDNTVLRWSLCVEEYKFLVLNNVFMYHLGIKSKKETDKMIKARDIAKFRYNKARDNFVKYYKSLNYTKIDSCLRKPNVVKIRKMLTDNIF
uniref:N-acetyllactosaminide beta-1,3-N-acetylglucosaminyltransferase n=1 Tax=Parastrongyloides trichosuri TaxID=131310 RepID=A0A0N4Z108_PARTI